jgi:purine nucleoside permease
MNAMKAMTGMQRLALALVAACSHHAAAPSDSSTTSPDAPAARAIKVMVIDMSSIEGGRVVSALGLPDVTTANGVTVNCKGDDVCEIVTGMGYANAASSMTALVYSRAFDLTKTYFIIGGIAGIDPEQGTLGTAAWARFAVDYGYSYELDAREMPAAWPYGYFGIGTTSPTAPPAAGYRGTFQLDEQMLQAALHATQSVQLEDSMTAQTARAMYSSAPADQPPVVTQCDVVSADTWFAGSALTERARDWMQLATNGAGTYCTSAQEDNATLEVLARAATAGKLDFSRVSLVRTASDFSAPYPGQTDADGLVGSLGDGGLVLSVDNLAATIAPLVQTIVTGWSTWQAGVPAG